MTRLAIVFRPSRSIRRDALFFRFFSFVLSFCRKHVALAFLDALMRYPGSPPLPQSENRSGSRTVMFVIYVLCSPALFVLSPFFFRRRLVRYSRQARLNLFPSMAEFQFSGQLCLLGRGSPPLDGSSTVSGVDQYQVIHETLCTVFFLPVQLWPILGSPQIWFIGFSLVLRFISLIFFLSGRVT